MFAQESVMENPEKIEIAGLKTIHKLCNFGADHNMEGCTFTEIVDRMFSKIEQMKAQVNTLDEMLLNQGEALAQAKAHEAEKLKGCVLVPVQCPDPDFADSLFDELSKKAIGEFGDDLLIHFSDIDEEKIWALMVEAAKAQAVLEKDAIIQKLSDQLYAQEMKTSDARVLCETACELLDDYAHQDAMVILNDLEQAMKEPTND